MSRILVVGLVVGVMAATPSAYAQVAPCNASTVAYWRFDGDLTDSCGEADGTAVPTATTDSSNVVPLAGNVGCLSLNGNPSRVDLPPNFSGTLSEGTIEAWVYLASDQQERGVIFNHGTAALHTDLCIEVRPGPSEGYVSLLHRQGVSPPYIPLPGFAPQSWHHLAWTWDGATITHYMDGVVLAAESSSMSVAFTGNEAEIGSDDQEVAYWNGRLDESCKDTQRAPIKAGME